MNRTLLALLACAAFVPAAVAAEPAPKQPAPAAAPAVKPTKIGVAKVDGKTITVYRIGAIVAGKELPLVISLPAGMAAPKSLTVWLAWGDGTNTGGTTDKLVATLKDGAYAVTVKVPGKRDLELGTAVWVSLEPATGKPILRSVGLM
jgi:hypothetical protein